MDSVKITYIGHACFKLSFNGSSLIIDPYANDYVPGLANVAESADKVYCSHYHDDHGCESAVEISGGEANWSVEELEVPHDDADGAKRGMNTIRIFTFGSLRIAHLGDIGRELTEDEAEALSGLDCMMLPVGGYYTIDAAQAKAIVERTRPKVVIPMHYRGEYFGYDVISRVTDFTDGLENVTFGGCEMVVTEDMVPQVRVLWPERAPERLMDKAIGCHTAGYNCAQSVLAALGKYTGMDEKTALAVSCGFGGGLRSGEVCGAISGAVMALGLCFPYNDSTDAASKAKIAELAKSCVALCGKVCGGVTCRDLLESQGGNRGCNRFIAHCTNIAEKMIIENKE